MLPIGETTNTTGESESKIIGVFVPTNCSSGPASPLGYINLNRAVRSIANAQSGAPEIAELNNRKCYKKLQRPGRGPDKSLVRGSRFWGSEETKDIPSCRR